MLSLNLGILLLGLIASGLCFTDGSELDNETSLDFVLNNTANCKPELDNITNLDPKLDNTENPEGRSCLLKGFNLFEVLKKLDICYLQCNADYCECCQKIKILLIKIEVCATVQFKRGDKKAQAGLKVAGIHLVSTQVKLEGHACLPVSTTIGPLDVCFDTKVLQDQPHLNSFPLCFKLEVSYEGVPSVLLTFGCQDVIVTITDKVNGDYRSTGVMKVLNGDQVAKAIQRLIADDAAQKN